MAARDASVYEEIIIEANDGSKTVDLRFGIVSMDYYEDLFSPTLTMKLMIINTGKTIPTKDGSFQSIYSGLPLRGGERVSIKIAGNSEINAGLDFSYPGSYFYVSKISNVIRTNLKEIFVLDLVSREAIANETSRVYKKFPKAKITDHVKTIVKENLKSDKAVIFDDTSNDYGFIGNMKKPFNLLVWLASKGIPAKNNATAGYFFYETQSGYNYRSIDSLIEKGKKLDKDKKIYKYIYSESQDISQRTDFDILSYKTEVVHDLLKELRLGKYASFFAQYNPLDGTFTRPQEGKFKLTDYTGKTTNLGDDPEVPKLLNATGLNLGDMPSRVLTGVLDIGTLEKDVNLQTQLDGSVGSNGILSQRQALFRYNSLFSQVVNMTIPLNTNLQVGDVIRCEFPKISVNSKEYDTSQSGLYMIKELCHNFTGAQSLTSLKLLRDTFGEFGN